MSEEKKNAPIQTLRDGAIVVKLWQQEGKNGPYVSATLGRTYQNEQTGEYGESRSLSGSDVLKAQALLGEANKEMVQWREYHKELDRQEQPEKIETPRQESTRETASPELTPEAARDPVAQNPESSLAQQRDDAMAQAAPSQTAPHRDMPRER